MYRLPLYPFSNQNIHSNHRNVNHHLGLSGKSRFNCFTIHKGVPLKKRTKWIIGIVSGIVLIGVLGAIFGEESESETDLATPAKAAVVSEATLTPAPESTPSEAATPVPTPIPTVVSFGNGTHEVGYDIQPGKYRSEGPEIQAAIFCSFARLKDAGAGIFNLDNVIDIQNTQGPAIVNIDASDGGFYSQNCKRWVRR